MISTALISMAFCIVSAFLVSTEIGTFHNLSSCKTGSNRFHSSLGVIESEFGRVDSAPISKISAPAASCDSACLIAFLKSYLPQPSPEKESSFTLTIPINFGVDKSNLKRLQINIFLVVFCIFQKNYFLFIFLFIFLVIFCKIFSKIICGVISFKHCKYSLECLFFGQFR